MAAYCRHGKATRDRPAVVYNVVSRLSALGNCPRGPARAPFLPRRARRGVGWEFRGRYVPPRSPTDSNVEIGSIMDVECDMEWTWNEAMQC